jgi:hypothetical protein
MNNTNTAAATTWINARIRVLIANGADPLDALRAVVGSDTVDAMIAQLYTELRTNAEARS